MELFTSFDGRIGRKGFWIGVLGLFVFSIVVGFAINFVFGYGFLGQVFRAAASLVVLFAWAAVLAKRLHDRNKPTMPWLLIFLVPTAISMLMGSFQIGFTEMNVAGQVIMMPGRAFSTAGMVSAVIGIWVLIEMGCLSGTDGHNNYGPPVT